MELPTVFEAKDVDCSQVLQLKKDIYVLKQDINNCYEKSSKK